MNDETQKKWLPLAILAAALVAWTSLLALGAFLQLGAKQPRHNYASSLVIMAVLGLFLATWGLAVWLRARRKGP